MTVSSKSIPVDQRQPRSRSTITKRNNTRILIIYTGGTVGMVIDPATGALKPIGFKEIRDNIPEIVKLGFEVEVHAFNPPMDSSNMHPEVWVELAGIISKKYKNYDGFVILHGSDTMAFTASALSFLLENLGKPVVLTGSQLPIGEIRTDAKENIITALEIAAARKAGKALVPEVCIYFDYQLFRGNRSKKYNAEKFEAFYSMNYPPLAEAGISIKYQREYILRAPEKALKVYSRLDPAVSVLKIFPGITPATVEAVLGTPGTKAVILETFGSGNATTAPWFIAALAGAVKRGVLVVDITQCDGGAVELGRYETSMQLKQIGVISGHDMTFEAALAKLMFLLAQQHSPRRIRELLETSLRGELTNGG
ncbi:asparaginase [Flavihumibacter petaseus]|uniref:asparaginase n=1 Tax=Flavihumibacter petaseus NBRC 106054 TaxID=1220578 RepID=A0A0E9MV70_9BACT|nr:type I asparaginase [Flavihumibacter petaseus]GAO41652.1 L-asparaginase I [Flavihumibacter petaseus NBRC 106054]